MQRFPMRLSAMLALCLGFFASRASGQHYMQTNLTSDQAGVATNMDAHLVNPWGLSRGTTTPWWASDNGTGLSTLYSGTGVAAALVVTVPTSDPNVSPTGTPTGTVVNVGTGFDLAANAPARFMWVTEDGTISGWNPAVAGTHSIIAVNNAGSAIYKGLAILATANGTFLYAADFKGAKVAVFDSNWQPVNASFVDASLPPGYAPFNVQALGSSIFVAFAKVGDLPDEQHGKGLGYVDEFDATGNLVRRFEHGPWLNAPWGMALAPAAGFGEFSGDLIVGQFGSGHLVAYDRNTGEFLGFLHGARGPLVIDGLWGLSFGNAGNNGAGTQLFFSAGPNDEHHGLFGFLTAKPGDGDDGSDE